MPGGAASTTDAKAECVDRVVPTSKARYESADKGIARTHGGADLDRRRGGVIAIVWPNE